MDSERRFPRPWTAVEQQERYVVLDAWGQTVAWLFFAEGQRRRVTGFLTKDEARRIAKAIARLPELLTRSKDAEPRQ
jgi:hypothetical protein